MKGRGEKALCSARCQIRIQFYDLDPMDVVWHGNYVKYFEEARRALLQQLNYDYPQMREEGYMWPIVDMQLRYSRPARYGMDVIVEASLVEWENRLRINYEIRDEEGRRLTKGQTTQVAVLAQTGEMAYVTPPGWRAAVAAELAKS